MNTVKSLQALYVKLGGNLTDTYSGIAGGIPVGDYSLIPDMIQACTQKAGSGSGGGAELFAVTLEIGEGSAATSGKTVAEIYAAYDAGDVILGVLDNDGDTICQPVIMTETAVTFSAIIDSDDGVAVITFSGSVSGETETWTYTVKSLTVAES